MILMEMMMMMLMPIIGQIKLEIWMQFEPVPRIVPNVVDDTSMYIPPRINQHIYVNVYDDIKLHLLED